MANMAEKADLSSKIESKKAVVGVIGMGYVGAALADLVIAHGYKTIGFVTRRERVEAIINQKKKNLSATTDISKLKTCDIVLICVQTPVDENKLPDLKFLKNASEQAANNLQKGQLIIIESSIATGTTRNVVLPILEATGLVAGIDFYLSFSPERVDPGNKVFDLGAIPKVVAGLEANSLKLAVEFYSQIMQRVVPVSTLETAEMVKLFENSFRLINISFVNELAGYTKSWGIDMWEVVEAAASKPFGFMPHYPSPGIGGHCIPVDPFYLLDDARKRGMNLSMIEEAGRINDAQPVLVASRVYEILKLRNTEEKNESLASPPTMQMLQLTTSNEELVAVVGEKGGSISSSSVDKQKVLLIGLSYKPDIDDVRESASLKIWELLEKAGLEVSYHDPFVPEFKETLSTPLSETNVLNHDLVVIATNHSNIDYEELAGYNIPILDTRRVYKISKPLNVHYL